MSTSSAYFRHSEKVPIRQLSLVLKLTLYTNCYKTLKLTLIVNFLRTKQHYWLTMKVGYVPSSPPPTAHPINGVVTISMYSQFEHEIGLDQAFVIAFGNCRSAHGIAENVVYNLQGTSICIHDHLETF